MRIRGPNGISPSGIRDQPNDWSKQRDTYKYEFKIGNRVVRSGITNDLERREGEHQRRPGWSRGHIRQVGRRTTRDGALRWEDEQRKRGKPTGP